MTKQEADTATSFGCQRQTSRCRDCRFFPFSGNFPDDQLDTERKRFFHRPQNINGFGYAYRKQSVRFEPERLQPRSVKAAAFAHGIVLLYPDHRGDIAVHLPQCPARDGNCKPCSRTEVDRFLRCYLMQGTTFQATAQCIIRRCKSQRQNVLFLSVRSFAFL